MTFENINKDVVKNNKPLGVVNHFKNKDIMEKYKILQVMSYEDAPKFKAHNIIEEIE